MTAENADHATQVTHRYRVRVLPQLHVLDITLTLVARPEQEKVRLALPTWVPGAYAFMRYGRDLSLPEVVLRDGGEKLQVRRDGWQGFVVDGVRGPIDIQYRVHAYDPAWGELTGFVGDNQAIVLGPRYLFSPDAPGQVEVQFETPAGWPLHVAGLASGSGQGPWTFQSLPALFDTPVVLGAFERVTVPVEGVPFHFVFMDRAPGFDRQVQGLVDDFVRVAQACHAVFGSFPFAHYTFVCTFNPESHWGLEHRASTMVSLGQHALIDANVRRSAIRLAAHELFHAWNVCRLQPAPLGQVDVVNGSFPDALWVSEGFTRYYEFLLATRTRGIPPDVFFSNVVNFYRHLEAMPAYARVTPKDASLSTFLNHHKYPGSINNAIDYYDHGMLVAFDLEVALRTSREPSTLDQTFRAFFDAYAGKGHGFSTADFRDFLAERHGEDIARIVDDEVETAGGLRVPESLEALGFELEREPVHFLGLVLEENTGPELVNVLDTSPAGMAGLAAGDVLLEVNEFPFELRVLRYFVDHESEVRLTVRRGALRRTYSVPVARRERISGLVWRGRPEQLERVRNWLTLPELAWTVGERLPLGAFDNFHGIQSIL